MKKFYCSVMAACAMFTMFGKQPQRPNVVVVIADDLGFGDVSFYGSKTIRTPNIDSLAANGLRFTNAYATSATSTPSRYGLLTGMYPWRRDVKILPGDAPLIIDTERYTLPKMMQAAGYRTGAVGKWHLGMGIGKVNWNDTIRPGAREVGFDYSCIIAATNDRVPTVYVENGGVVNLDPNDPISVDYTKNFDGEPTALDHPEMLKMMWDHGHNNSIVNGIPRIGFMKGGEKARWVDEDMADYFVDKVKSFVSESADRPFFLYYGLHEPHVPRAPHQRFAGTTTMGPRGDAIVEADWCVGQLVNTLDSLNLLDNTMIIFTSDNGPVLNDGYKDGAVENVGDHKPTAGLRGGKYSIFEGGMHIPLLVYWRGHVTPATSDAMVCLMDLAASLGNFVGGEVPAGLDSRDMMATWLGESEESRSEIIIEAQGKLALRQGDYVMIPPYFGAKTNETGNELGNLGEFALFNVKTDPYQQHNLATEDDARLQSMYAQFLKLTEGYFTPSVARR
jgi:arylsulfatase A-like enzyme